MSAHIVSGIDQDRNTAAKARAAKRYAENRDAILARTKAYRAENHEAFLARKRAYYAENRDAILARQKTRRATNPGKFRDDSNAWYAVNREKIRAKRKDRRVANPASFRDKDKAYYVANRDKRRAYAKAYQTANADRARNSKLRRKYGISLAKKTAILEAQGGACGICGTTEWGNQGHHVDHCHGNGRVRGILCGRCNHGLGSFRDNIELLMAAIKYLKPK